MAGPRRKAIRYVNQLRREHGVEPLKWDRSLKRPTRKHSRYMARTGDFSHTEGDVLTRKMNRYVGKGEWDLAGENIGTVPVGSLDGLMEAFRKSPEHRRNMLRPRYDNIGVGLARNPDGQLYLTYWFYG